MAFQLDNISKQVKPAEGRKETTSILKKEIIVFKKPFSNKVKEDFYIELSVLLKAGVTLKNALELIERSHKKRQTREILQKMTASIIEGQSLSEVIKGNKHFTDYEYHSVRIGEETGTITKVAEQLGDFYARKNEQRRNLISALTYPAIILFTAVLVVVFMLNYVVPMFQDIFKQQQVELPGITKFIINCSEFLKSYGWPIFIGIIILFSSRAILNKKAWFKRTKDNMILKIPFVGNFVKTVYLSQFTQAVALLTSSKVPVVNSIQLVKQMINFYPLQEALEIVEQDILMGKALSDSLGNHKIFDDKMIALVKVAEETNQNEFIFERLNAQYNAEVQQRSKMLSTVMEPLIIVIIGVLVGVILVAMYLPMFKLSNVLS